MSIANCGAVELPLLDKALKGSATLVLPQTHRMQEYRDAKGPNGRMDSGPHRREVRNICCMDHRVTNDIMRAVKDAGFDAVLAQHEKLQQAEHAAMLQKQAAEAAAALIC